MTAAIVTLCRCGHAERMHERDADAEHDRGACLHANGLCGCSQFRPDDGTEVPAPPVRSLVPVASSPVAKPDTADPERPEPAERRTRAERKREIERPGDYKCPDCPRTFDTPQGVGPHRRKAHGHTRLPAAAKQGTPSQPSSSAAEPSVRPDSDARLASSGTATQEGSAAGSGDAPAVTAGPCRSVKDSRTVRVEFEAGWLELNYELDWTQLPFEARSPVMDLTSVLFRLGHVDHFAAVIGDEESDDFKGDSR